MTVGKRLARHVLKEAIIAQSGIKAVVYGSNILRISMANSDGQLKNITNISLSLQYFQYADLARTTSPNIRHTIFEAHVWTSSTKSQRPMHMYQRKITNPNKRLYAMRKSSFLRVFASHIHIREKSLHRRRFVRTINSYSGITRVTKPPSKNFTRKIILSSEFLSECFEYN